MLQAPKLCVGWEKTRNRAYEVEAQEYVPWGTQHKIEEYGFKSKFLTYLFVCNAEVEVQACCAFLYLVQKLTYCLDKQISL